MIFLSSCAVKSLRKELKGIWVFESEVNTLYLNDSSSFFQSYPIIFDFQDDNQVRFIRLGNFSKDTLQDWVLKNKNTLTINENDYIIKELKGNKIKLIDLSRPDTFLITLRKTENFEISNTRNEIEKIFTSTSWSSVVSTNLWQSNFDYFDNGTMIYRYPIFDKNLEDSTDNLQLETWGVYEYKKLFFLYNYNDMKFGNGYIDDIAQIKKIDSISYTVITDNGLKIFISKNIEIDLDSFKHLLHGKWVSLNSSDKTYGKYIPKRTIKNGLVVQYQDSLIMNVTNEFVQFKLDSLKPKYKKWQLSHDGKTLILEHQVDDFDRKGTKISYLDIMKASSDSLKIRLFDNYFYTQVAKPNSYIVNIIQEFKRKKTKPNTGL